MAYANGKCNSSPKWSVCSRNPSTCSPAQTERKNEFRQAMVDLVKASKQFETPANGFFIHSCFTHCEGMGNNYIDRFAIGGTSMSEAVSRWWKRWGEGGSTLLP